MYSTSRSKYVLVLSEIACFKIMVIFFLLFMGCITASLLSFHNEDNTESVSVQTAIFTTLSVTFVLFELIFVAFCGCYLEKTQNEGELAL